MRDNIYHKWFMDSLSDSQKKEYGQMSINQQKDWYIGYLESHYKAGNWLIEKSWLPTVENINCLPEPVRKYIHEIETMSDPSGIIRENAIARETIKSLEILKTNTGEQDA